MTPFTPQRLADYLGAVHAGTVGDVRVTPLGGGRQGDKGYGYGIPLRVDYLPVSYTHLTLPTICSV